MRSVGYSQKAARHAMRIEYLENRLCLAGDCHFAADGTEDYARAVHSINCLAAEVYEHLQAESGNLLVSPASLGTALAMFYEGTAGETAREMENVLRLGDDGNISSSFASLHDTWEENAPKMLSESSQGLCDSLPAEFLPPGFCDTGAGYEIDLANAFWPADGTTVNESFRDTIENDYQGAVRNLDYSRPEATDIINEWVNEKTRGKIEELYDKPLPAGTVMTLANSVYFKSLWAAQFDPDSTREAPFTLASGGTVDVPMMSFSANTSIDEFDAQGNPLPTVSPHYAQIDGFEILDRQLHGERASLVFMMPTDPDAANEITPALLANIDDWMSGPRETPPVNVFLPKFEATSTIDLLPLLSGMMPATFPAGDFSNMLDAPFDIGDARQKVFLEINEQGTEAAAVTAFSGLVCFAAGTPVRTPSGVKRIEELRVGDFVLSRDEFNEHGEVRRKKIEEVFNGEAELWSIHIGGKEIRVTESHRFFLKEKGWTPANEISVGDLIASADIDVCTPVEQVRCTGEIEPVFNFRVADYHTYFVGEDDWEFDVWTHNDYGSPDLCPIPEFRADRPFHFMIRENETSSILFMGRIDDPTQMNNNVRPTVQVDAQQPGDFDGDATMDIADADALAAAILSDDYDADFDLNDDGHVDVQDLDRWRVLAGAANLVSGAAYPRGDANLDGMVNPADLNVLGSNWQQRDVGFSRGDLNADGIVDVVDLNRIGSGWLEDVSGAAASRRTPRAPLATAVFDPSTMADSDNAVRSRLPSVNHLSQLAAASPTNDTSGDTNVTQRMDRFHRAAIQRRYSSQTTSPAETEATANPLVSKVFEAWDELELAR